MRKRYYVGGAGSRYATRGWFTGVRPPARNGWRNFVVTKTLAHALRQFNRLPVRYRQIDVHGDGPARCVLWGRNKRSGA